MSTMSLKKPLGVVLGTVFTVTLSGAPLAQAAENPFAMTALPDNPIRLAEGKCGEGKCGAGKQVKHGMACMDANGDGMVTKEESMQGHAVMFDEIDVNDDGIIDNAERQQRMQHMKGCMNGKAAGR